MSNLTIGQKIIGGFAAIILITIALGIFAYQRLSTVNDYSKKITQDCLPGVYQISKAEGLVRENMLTLDRRILLQMPQKSPKWTITWTNCVTRWMQTCHTDYEKTIFEPEDRDLFNSLQKARGEYKNIKDNVVAPLVHESGREDALNALNKQLVPAYKKYEEAVQKLVDYNKQSADDTSVKITSAVEAGKAGSLIGLAVAVGLAVGISFLNHPLHQFGAECHCKYTAAELGTGTSGVGAGCSIKP